MAISSGVPPMPQHILAIDFETRSDIDIKLGVHKYCSSPFAKVILVCWKPLVPTRGQSMTWCPEIVDMTNNWALLKLKTELELRPKLVAHNMDFDAVVWEKLACRDYPNIFPPLSEFEIECTAVRATMGGLPRSLEKCAEALESPVQKYKYGYTLIRKFCTPKVIEGVAQRKPDGTPLWHVDKPHTHIDWPSFVQYGKGDCNILAHLDAQLPPIKGRDADIYRNLHMPINARGITINKEFVKYGSILAQRAQIDQDKAIRKITGGFVPKTTNHQKLLEWVKREAPVALKDLESVDKKNLIRILTRNDVPEHVKGALRARKIGSKSSVAKIDAAARRMDERGVVRDGAIFFGATTGRQAGSGLQLQNFTRNTSPNWEEHLDAIKWAVNTVGDEKCSHAIRLLYDEPLDILSSMLRGMVEAPPGYMLVHPDFSQIEARVITWLAGAQDLLDVFARGDDVYVYTANKIGSTSRQLGKVLVLGCGFGMGGAKFQTTANDPPYNLGLDEATAHGSVRAWRQSNPKIPDFWYKLEELIRWVIETPGRKLFLKPTPEAPTINAQCDTRANWLTITLPSGRDLWYYKPEIGWDGERGRPTITFMTVNAITKVFQREKSYGGKFAENITQAVARDIMWEAAIRMQIFPDFAPVGTVHDELIFQVPKRPYEHWKFQEGTPLHKLLVENPDWTKGLPIAAKISHGVRWGK